ncbi:MAG: hypothetical protein ACR2P6_09875 [Gammaproteobacteria bacterium]
MRKLAVIGGLLLGLVSGLAIVVFTPMRSETPIPLETAGDTIYYNFVAIDVQGKKIDAPVLFGLDRFFTRSDGFTEEGIEHASAAVMALRDESGRPAAIATRMSYVRTTDSLLTESLGTEVYWNIFWPNEGSVFLIGYESYWSLIKELLLSRLPEFAKFGFSSASALSVVPEGADSPGVFGSTGSNKNLSGQFIEAGGLDAADAETGQLRLQISQ